LSTSSSCLVGLHAEHPNNRALSKAQAAWLEIKLEKLEGRLDDEIAARKTADLKSVLGGGLNNLIRFVTGCMQLFVFLFFSS
jgi:hypothetical protein